MYHDKFLYFLTCNPKEGVTKYNIDKHRKEKVPDSKIPNNHLFTDVKGLQVGKYFWIFGGIVPSTNQWESINFQQPLPHQLKTDLWVMNRNIWIDGPELHQKLWKDSTGYCSSVLNSTVVIFVGAGDLGKDSE